MIKKDGLNYYIIIAFHHSIICEIEALDFFRLKTIKRKFKATITKPLEARTNKHTYNVQVLRP